MPSATPGMRGRDVPGRDFSMFTMTLYAVGRKMIARGANRVGETWEDTLIRLQRGTLPEDEPARRVVAMTYEAGEAGSPTNLVMLGHGAPEADAQTDPPILVSTDPPQF